MKNVKTLNFKEQDGTAQVHFIQTGEPQFLSSRPVASADNDFMADLRKASRRLDDMAKSARDDHRAGRTRRFPE